MTTEGNDRVYTFGGGSDSGYNKSMIRCKSASGSYHTGVDAATGNCQVTFTLVGREIQCTDSVQGTNVRSSRWTIEYYCSTPPEKGEGGSITISPMTQFTQKAIKPAKPNGGSSTGVTKTFLIKENERG